MEDLFQILFILFFIITSIASSFKKKKKQQQNKSVPKPQPVQQKKESQKQKSSAEMLEEILGFKIEKPEPQTNEVPPYQQPNLPERDQENATWDPVAEYQDTEYRDAEVDKKTKYEKSIQLKKHEFESAKSKHKAFKSEEKVQVKKKEPNKFASLFSDKNNLKNYIIIQEILNKPKAHRR